MVDVGCGDGGASTFAGDAGASVISVDIDPAQIAIVKNRMRNSKASAFEAHVSDSNPLPIPDKTASKVVCLEVLEHVDDPAQVMSELVRVGQPGSQYLVSVPDPASEAVQKEIAPACYWQKPNHLCIFQREEFGEFVTTAGLCIEERIYSSFYWAMYWTLFWAAEQELGETDSPILKHWARTWRALISSRSGAHIKRALDNSMPQKQVILARKPKAVGK